MIEFLLSTFYFIAFCFLISKLSFFKDSKIPKYWFIIIFGVKIGVSVLLTLIYTKYYNNRATADIFKYFDDSKVMFSALKSNPLDYFKMLLGIDFNYNYYQVNYYQFMNHWNRPYSSDLISDSHIIIRFNAFVRLFSFGFFQVHHIFINFVSLIGLTLIYKAFKLYLLDKEKLLFYVVFLVPSVLFWGSGLLKEGIILFAFGLFFYYLFKLTNQLKTSYLLLFFFAIILLIFTKFYLLIALSIPSLGYLINYYRRLKNPLFGYLIAGLIFLITINVAPLINEQLDVVFQIANKQQTFSRFIAEVPANSGFVIPELSDGWSLIIYSPQALLNTMIRPYFWECNSLFVWLSAFENVFIIGCFILVFYYRKKINNSHKNIIYFNLTFVFSLFVLIGLTTPVLGAIVRYKIPGLILLLISLSILIDFGKMKTKLPFLKKLL